MIRVILWSIMFFASTAVFAEVPDSFDVTVSKNPAGISEAIDLTVKAVRTDGSVVTDYT